MGSGNSQEKAQESSPVSTSLPTGKVIYTLTLSQGKYYVGMTENLERRLSEHKSGDRGSVWTKKYLPIISYTSRPFLGGLDEDNEVEKLMMIHGIDNVRGGTYSMIKLSKEQYDVMNIKILHAKGACLRCGGMGHYIKDCKEKTGPGANVKGGGANAQTNVKDGCLRCGFKNHSVSTCNAKKIVGNISMDNIHFCSGCGRKEHREWYFGDCDYKTDRDKRKKKEGQVFCMKCGSREHDIFSCNT